MQKLCKYKIKSIIWYINKPVNTYITNKYVPRLKESRQMQWRAEGESLGGSNTPHPEIPKF
jgi:hypothetical protein